jgi:hypothetical protein
MASNNGTSDFRGDMNRTSCIGKLAVQNHTASAMEAVCSESRWYVPMV